ncbi:MAG: peptidylprolyl isomerase [Pseudomonadota bacterium]
MMKFKLLPIIGLSFLFALLLPLTTIAATEESLDGIAAIVNNQVITQSQLQTQISGIMANLKVHHQPIPAKATLSQLVLKKLIDTNLQLQIAKRQGIDVSNRQVNQTIRLIAAQNHMSVAKMRGALAKSGVDYTRYRKQIHDQLMVRAVQQQYLSEKIHVTKQDIQKQIDKFKNNASNNPFYHLDIINLPLPHSATESNIINAKINEIMQSLRSGMSMTTAAINASTPSLLIQSQDIGWHQLNQLPPAVEARIGAAKIGDVIGPIQNGNMISLIKVIAIKHREFKKIVEQYHLRQIVIKTGQDISPSEAQLMLKKVRQQIIHGQSFAQLAQTYSESPSRAKGGDLGWQTAHAIAPKTFAVINKLKPQQISAPYQIKNNWILTQYLGKRKKDLTDEILGRQIRAYLYSKQADKVLANWVKTLRKESFIKIMNT